MKNRFGFVILCTVILLAAGCTTPAVDPAPVAPVSQGTVAGPDKNIEQGCVENYDPNVDYFPDKTEMDYAEGLEVTYHNNYKVVRVLNPWSGAESTFDYVLVQCGTPAPEGYEEAQIIQVPLDNLVALSSTVIPGLVEMDLLDRLTAVEEFDYINTAEVRALIDEGSIAEVSDGGVLDLEQVLDQDPDLVMTFAYGSPDYDAHPKLLEAGLNTAVTADYMETSPLGRAEWIKFTALFFNTEARAEAAFTETAARYNEMVSLAEGVAERPTVFTGINRGDAWRVSGGNSYFARFLADSGADFLWADNDSTGSVPLDFEVVYERAADSDYWMPNSGYWQTLEDVAAADERYAEFGAFANGSIFNNNANVNEFGGNDYWETGISNPDLILADLLHIFHPDLLPDHELVFFKQLEGEDN